MKFAAIIAALISVLSLSSCLNDSGSDNSYDFSGYLSLKESYLGEKYLVMDNGFALMPVNSSVLSSIKLQDGSYVNRFYGAIKLAEGETITSDKTSYNITSVQMYTYVVDLPFTTKPDTISGDYGIADIRNDIWAASGYVNVPLYYYYSNTAKVNAYQFNMYATGTDKDTLFVTLQQSRNIGSSEYVTPDPQLISYSMPFNNPEFALYYSRLQPQKDSVVIKLSAKVFDKTTPIIKTTKYKFSDR